MPTPPGARVRLRHRGRRRRVAPADRLFAGGKLLPVPSAAAAARSEAQQPVQAAGFQQHNQPCQGAAGARRASRGGRARGRRPRSHATAAAAPAPPRPPP